MGTWACYFRGRRAAVVVSVEEYGVLVGSKLEWVRTHQDILIARLLCQTHLVLSNNTNARCSSLTTGRS